MEQQRVAKLQESDLHFYMPINEMFFLSPGHSMPEHCPAKTDVFKGNNVSPETPKCFYCNTVWIFPDFVAFFTAAPHCRQRKEEVNKH